MAWTDEMVDKLRQMWTEGKTATEIAIETLLQEAKIDYYAFKPGIPLREYLELTNEQYERWVR